MKERSYKCFDCVHLTVDSGWGGSEVTPGEPLQFFCREGKWTWSYLDHTSKRDLADCLCTGDTCPKFKEDNHE